MVLRQEDVDTTSLTQQEYRALRDDSYFNDDVRQAMTADLLDIEHQLAAFSKLLPELQPTVASNGSLPTEAFGAKDDLCVVNVRSPAGLEDAYAIDLLFQLLLRSFRLAQHDQGRPTTFIVLGADRIGSRHLLDLARVALGMTRHGTADGTRIVYVFSDLSPSVQPLIGLEGGAAAFMRLGSAESAEAACRFIGKQYTLTVTGLTEGTTYSVTHTSGDQDTQSLSESTTLTKGDSTTHNRTDFWFDGPPPSTSRGTSMSRATGTSGTRSWGVTRSLAEGRSTATSQSIQRVHEYRIEPERIQELPETGLCYMAHGQGEKPVFIDCNPDIVSVPGVASAPLASITGGKSW